MGKKIFQSKVSSGRDSDVCGLTGNMANKPRMNELANKRGLGLLLGGTPVTISGALQTSLTNSSVTESTAKTAIANANGSVLFSNSNITFKDLADSYCGINKNTQIIFIYD